jgi:hypothetical protein
MRFLVSIIPLIHRYLLWLARNIWTNDSDEIVVIIAFQSRIPADTSRGILFPQIYIKCKLLYIISLNIYSFSSYFQLGVIHCIALMGENDDVYIIPDSSGTAPASE